MAAKRVVMRTRPRENARIIHLVYSGETQVTQIYHQWLYQECLQFVGSLDRLKYFWLLVQRASIGAYMRAVLWKSITWGLRESFKYFRYHPTHLNRMQCWSRRSKVIFPYLMQAGSARSCRMSGSDARLHCTYWRKSECRRGRW